MVPELMAAYHIQAYALGTLSAFFYYPYVLMQLPVGILVDRYGSRCLLAFTAFACAGGCYLFAGANSLPLAQLGRFIMGFSASFAFVGTLKLASVWFPPRRFGLMASSTQALGMLGAAVGEAPMSLAVAAIGWQHTLFAVASIFLILGIFIFLVVRNKPSDENRYKMSPPCTHLSRQKNKPNHLLAGFVRVLKNPQSWLNGLYAGLVFAPTTAIAEFWGVSFIKTAYHISNHKAAAAISLVFIGWAMGGPLTGWLSDRLGKRRPIMIASALLGAITMFSVIFFTHMPVALLFALLFIYGLTNTGVGIAYAVASEINPHSIAGTSLAFSNMASVLLGAALMPVIGFFIERHWDNVWDNNTPIYSVSDYQHALWLIPLCSFLGLFIAFMVKETHCKPMKTE